MTTTTTDYLLNAQDISKHYGAVVALRSASLAVRPGEPGSVYIAEKGGTVRKLTGTAIAAGNVLDISSRVSRVTSSRQSPCGTVGRRRDLLN